MDFGVEVVGDGCVVEGVEEVVVELGLGIDDGVVDDDEVVDDDDLVDDDEISRNTAAVTGVAEVVEVTAQAPTGAVPSAHLYFPSLMPAHTWEVGISTPSSW